jgi:putative spermidine/putrescine transport system permease protein
MLQSFRKHIIWVSLISGVVFLFLLLPMLVVVPLSFNAEPYFSLPVQQYSTRWYRSIHSSLAWQTAFRNSFIVAISTVCLAVPIGVLAAIGLNSVRPRERSALFIVYLLPLIIPQIITALGVFFLFSDIGLARTLTGLALAHTLLAFPFVVLAVDSSLSQFDNTLIRAGFSLGARPLRVLFTIIVPNIAPGIIAGTIFAFMTSFDEVVMVIFLASPEQFTVPREMWKGAREEISPEILAVASIMMTLTLVVFSALELIREKGNGARPQF